MARFNEGVERLTVFISCGSAVETSYMQVLTQLSVDS
jgi:hypothetical protein